MGTWWNLPGQKINVGKFITNLESIEIDKGGLFKRPRYRLTAPLIYRSKTVGLIISDQDSLTDFDSTPRIPIFYMLLGNRGKAAAALHDHLYREPHELICGYGIKIDRKTADRVLRGATYESLRITEPETLFDNLANIVCLGFAWLIWAGVRVGGASHWK